jgi:hypothetical protein
VLHRIGDDGAKMHVATAGWTAAREQRCMEPGDLDIPKLT